jgi:hypothetical protein
MVVPPSFADLRHPAERWQTVFARMMLMTEKSMQNADRCDIHATVLPQRDEFPPIRRVFFATPRNKKSGHPTFGRSLGTVPGACDATRAATRYSDNRAALFNVR